MRCLAPLAALVLAACSSSGDTTFEQLLPAIRAELAGDEDLDIGAELKPTREELNKIPFATIAVSYKGLPRVFMVPLADNGGYLTYQDKSRRGVVMFGGAVAGSDGLGDDLRAVRHAADDPVAHRRPLARWPRVVTRVYEFRVRGVDAYIVAPTCVYQPLERQTIEIVELRFPTTRVDEICTTADRQFVNSYWVADDGFIWASRQWLGPNLEPVYVEIVRPYG